MSAPVADEVVVVVGVQFELDGGASHLERLDQPLAHQFLEVPVLSSEVTLAPLDDSPRLPGSSATRPRVNVPDF